jgi:hypothetical protein
VSLWLPPPARAARAPSCWCAVPVALPALPAIDMPLAGHAGAVFCGRVPAPASAWVMQLRAGGARGPAGCGGGRVWWRVATSTVRPCGMHVRQAVDQGCSVGPANHAGQARGGTNQRRAQVSLPFGSPLEPSVADAERQRVAMVSRAGGAGSHRGCIPGCNGQWGRSVPCSVGCS